MGIEVSERTDLNVVTIKDQFNAMIQDHFKLYENYVLINTSFFVSHGHLISIYDVIQQKWVKHFNFEQKIEVFFRNQKDLHLYNVGILFEDQTFKIIDSEDISVPENWALEDLSLTIPGKLLYVHTER